MGNINSRRANLHWKQVRDARKTEHWAAKSAPLRIETFTVGDLVRVRKTGIEVEVVGQASWGDYQLKGLNGYFSGSQLELVSKKE